MKSKREVVLIHGKRMTLEERVCRCGCGIKFKTLLSSPQQFARRACALGLTLDSKSSHWKNWGHQKPK